MLEIVSASHLDHGLTEAHVEWLKQYFSTKEAFFLETVELPETLAPLDCGLYGPAMGDEPVAEEDVHYAIRGNRKCASRLVKKPTRQTRKVTVIGGPHEGKPCILYTAYGGPASPREPGDLTLDSWEKVTEAREYWAAHALVVG